jgi:hypothetical protein
MAMVHTWNETERKRDLLWVTWFLMYTYTLWLLCFSSFRTQNNAFFLVNLYPLIWINVRRSMFCFVYVSFWWWFDECKLPEILV